MTYRTIQERVALNCSPCEARGCPQPRYGASNYCRRHREAKRRYGHPDGRRIFPRDYARERREVAALIAAHKSHAGIVWAIREIDSWLSDAAAGRPGVCATELGRLALQGVSAERVLTEASAVWLFAHRRRSALPDDIRLTFALGIAVLHMAPRPLRREYVRHGRAVRRYAGVTANDRAAIGRAIRESFCLLLHNIALACDKAAVKKRAAREAMAATIG